MNSSPVASGAPVASSSSSSESVMPDTPEISQGQIKDVLTNPAGYELDNLLLKVLACFSKAHHSCPDAKNNVARSFIK